MVVWYILKSSSSILKNRWGVRASLIELIKKQKKSKRRNDNNSTSIVTCRYGIFLLIFNSKRNSISTLARILILIYRYDKYNTRNNNGTESLWDCFTSSASQGSEILTKIVTKTAQSLNNQCNKETGA